MKRIQKILNGIRVFLRRIHPEKTVHYINSPQVLPAQMSREEEEDCMCRLARGDEEVRQILIERNLRLVVYIAKKYENSGVPQDDLVSIGTIGLIKAVNTFRPDKNIKLATYASRCIGNEILMYLRKIGSLKAEVSLDEPLNTDWDGNELLLSDILTNGNENLGQDIESDDEVNLLHRCVERLQPREREIICYRFGLNGNREYTQKEVADMLHISQSYISRLEKKIICRLRMDMEKEIKV